MNCDLLDFLVDLSQIITSIVALIGLLFIWRQIKKQTEQLHSERLISLYQDFDTPGARSDRSFLFNKFRKIKKPTDEQVEIAKRVLASLDRMSYQVIRKFVDRKSAYDLYSRVLMKVMLCTWQWLKQERRNRNDPKGHEYCNNAETLAKEFAIENLHHLNKWKLSYKTLDMPDLLEKSLNAHK